MRRSIGRRHGEAKDVKKVSYWPTRPVLMLIALCLAVALALPARTAGQLAGYEVWTIDQADVGRGGARLYIYDGQRLEAGPTVGQTAPPQVVDLTEVTEEGRTGRRVGFLPIGDQAPASANDPHVVAIRPTR